MKKLSAVILCLCLMLFCMSACTSKPKDTEDMKGTSQTEEIQSDKQNADKEDTTKPADRSGTEKQTGPESSTEPEETAKSGNDKGIELPKIGF